MSTEITETLVEQGIPINPFPGLRPFEFEESHLFFGRDGQSEQSITKLGATHFLAVVGTSGSGKSSLVRAGLIPSLLGGFMKSAGSNWRIAVMRPGNDPIRNLARALNSTDVFGSEITENSELQTVLAEATLQRGSRGLVDTVRQALVAANENLLILVDQFEEIFRFARVAEDKEYRNEAAAFVKLLLEAARQREIPIYVVLTMRSDYLGDCSQFWGLPEAINESQYLIPRLTRDQLKEAMVGPISVATGQITPRLIARLLNEVGDDQDQLPVLQHLLMRMWDEWKDPRLEIEEVRGGKTYKTAHRKVHAGEALDLCCYDAVGGMAEALSRHADDAFNDLADQRSGTVAEKLFKALTEKGVDNREIRRPATLGELCVIADARAEEVIQVIETFRRPGRSFLMPPAVVPLTSESLIDISHESLIRRWTRLKEWVEEESRSARIYRRVAETAVLEAEGVAGLWRDPDLQIALTWREKAKPNQAWAQRYHREFPLAMTFLDKSVGERDREIREKDLQRKKAIKRTRLTAFVFAFLFLVSLVALFFANQQRVRANGLLHEVIVKSKDNEKIAIEEEKSRLARQVAERQREISEKNAKEAQRLHDLADLQRAEAVKQKAIAEEQRLKASRLEKKAREEANEAQQINSLVREVNKALADGEAKEVISKALQQIEYYRKRQDQQGEYESQTILGPAYLDQGQYREAQASAESALSIQENQQINDKKGEHENLAVLREAYLRFADEKADTSRQDHLLNAYRTALRALRVQEGAIGADSPDLIPDLASLAAVTDRRGEHENSEGFRNRIVEIQKKNVQGETSELVSYLYDLAKFNRLHGDYPHAEARLKEVLKIQEQFLAPNDPVVIATLDSLAEVYRLEKNDAEAEALVKRVQGLQGNTALLRKGTSGPEVKKLQEQLLKLGLFKGTVDEYFGESTEAAVIQFQSSQGLQADGVVGSATIDRLQQPQRPSIGMKQIQSQLQTLGFYTGSLDGSFGIRTKAAIANFQRSKGLAVDGNVNPETLAALGFKTEAHPSVTGKVTVGVVQAMFPNVPVDNIKANLPDVLRALEDAGLADEDMVLMALTTIGIETGSFAPLTERKSRFNTSADGYPFDLYDNRKELGNQGPPDGERFKGRGYVQLTGRAEYQRVSKALGMGDQLVENPDLASQPDIAARILVRFLKVFEGVLRPALKAGDFAKAQRTWVGKPVQEKEFTKAFQIGASLIQ